MIIPKVEVTESQKPISVTDDGKKAVINAAANISEVIQSLSAREKYET